MRRVLLNLAFSLVPLVVLLLVGEAAVRLLGPKPDMGNAHEPLPDSPRRYRQVPGAEGFVGGEPLHINSYGMRDREYALEKRPTVRRIAILGDSYTYGSTVPSDMTFAKLLERRLNDGSESLASDSLTYEVMNFGVRGYDTVQELATLRDVALALSPDLVIVAYFLNDVGDPPIERRATSGDHVQPRAAARPPLPARLRELLVKNSRLAAFLIQKLAILIRTVVDVPYQGAVDYNRPFVENDSMWRRSRSALAEIKALCDSLGIGVMLVVIPEMGNFNELYPFRPAHDTLRVFCETLRVPCCDLLDKFMAIEAKTLWAAPDDPHFNRRAHRLAALAIDECLTASGLLRRARTLQPSGPPLDSAFP